MAIRYEAFFPEVVAPTTTGISLDGSTVLYDITDGAGGTILQNQIGTLLNGESQVQPSGIPPPAPIAITTDPNAVAGLAINPRLANAQDYWVDETGDAMTGTLDMQDNTIDNARLDSGNF